MSARPFAWPAGAMCHKMVDHNPFCMYIYIYIHCIYHLYTHMFVEDMSRSSGSAAVHSYSSLTRPSLALVFQSHHFPAIKHLLPLWDSAN